MIWAVLLMPLAEHLEGQLAHLLSSITTSSVTQIVAGASRVEDRLEHQGSRTGHVFSAEMTCKWVRTGCLADMHASLHLLLNVWYRTLSADYI